MRILAKRWKKYNIQNASSSGPPEDSGDKYKCPFELVSEDHVMNIKMHVF